MNRYLNKTDFLVISACLLSLIAFSINIFLSSVIPLYFNAIVILGAFLYWVLWKKDPSGILQKSLIIGSSAGILYIFLDNIFVNQMIIVYLRTEDLKITGTPISLILTWMYSISISLYIYQRLRGFFGEFYIPSILTGTVAFLSIILFDFLGNKARIWEWPWNIAFMASKPPYIFTTPLFFPIALFLTFFLSPWIIGGQRITRFHIGFSDNPLVGGIRFAVILATTMFLFFRVFMV